MTYVVGCARQKGRVDSFNKVWTPSADAWELPLQLSIAKLTKILQSVAGHATFVVGSDGSDKPRRQRGRGLAEGGTGMCSDGASDRISAAPKSRCPAALPSLAETGD
ncbi:hypothetical protein JWH04_03665 [Xanthomonas melonis]|uniref:hypothetical protein n=1 Tax=Xanthomonas melonis TaxID=56456 RepID=UPI001E524D61|nr:hypothetical protein [Xanthomonas melonis]MCD0278054.1 hypothetical protein [Xanthomonas melonis]